MIIKFSKSFVKQRDKAPSKIQKALDKRLTLFIDSPRDAQLNFHKLNGVLKDYFSINISGDWRVILKFVNKNEVVIFLMLGTHSELYK